MKKQKKNRKDVAENLKPQQYSLIERVQTAIFLLLIGCNPIFAATKEENLSDEFFNAAMNLPTDETTAVSVQASDVATNAAANNSNFMQPVSDAFNKSVEAMQSFGTSLSSQIEKLIGHNPFLSKLLVALILVVVSIVVIVILALIAKKIISKNNNKNTIFNTNSSDVEDDDFEEVIEDSDEFPDEGFAQTVNNQAQTETDNTSETQNTVNYSAKILTSPTTVDDAMKMFLKITE